MMEPCIQEARITKLETGFEYFIKRTADHISEGDRQGGYRDRVLILEKEMQAQREIIGSLKKAEWKRVIGGGIVGGIIVRSPELLSLLKHLFGL
jgi:hypothetical protein